MRPLLPSGNWKKALIWLHRSRIKVKTITRVIVIPTEKSLPVNAFLNGETTDSGDGEEVSKTWVFSGRRAILMPWARAVAVREWHSTCRVAVHFLPQL